MDLNRNNLKRIRGLILFTAVVCLAVIKIDRVLNGFFFVIGILKPFIYGAVAAFVLNIPMSAIEKRLFGNGRNSKNTEGKKAGEHIPCFHIGDIDHGCGHCNGSAPADKDDDGVGE